MQDFSVSAIEFCLFSLLFLNSLGNRTLVRGTGRWSRRCTLPALVNCSWTPHRAEKQSYPSRSFHLFLEIYFTWKMTTLPPLSPVASNSPSWLNSTHDMISAEKKIRVGF